MFRRFTFNFGNLSMTSGPHLDDQYLHESLIRRHLFPAVKEDFDEIPPVFSSDSLSLGLSEQVYDSLGSVEKGEPFSPMRHTFLKFNGNVRTIQIPHPVPYMRLSRELSDNWQDIEDLLDSESSRVRPKVHDDGRFVTMEYGDKTQEAMEEASMLVGARYVVHTDITNCFPSIYTHAIDWALRGRSEAKKNRGKQYWQSRIDMRVSDLQDRETNGVGIGPGSSNLVAEILLQSIDRKLEAVGHRFTRFIDDYHCYANSRQEAEKFIYDLNDELYNYRLSLNHKKTEILDIESVGLDAWLHESSFLAIDPGDSDLVMIRKLRGYQDLARRFPDKSVLIYGIKALSGIVGKIKPDTLNRIAPELARMVWISPFLAPKIVMSILPTIEQESEGSQILMKALQQVFGEASRKKQADVVMWSLFGLSQHNHTVQDFDVFECLKWNPTCMALGLALFPSELSVQLVGAARGVDRESRQLVEEHWLLRYQLWLRQYLNDNDLEQASEAKYFPLLRDNGADFFMVPSTWKDPQAASE